MDWKRGYEVEVATIGMFISSFDGLAEEDLLRSFGCVRRSIMNGFYYYH